MTDAAFLPELLAPAGDLDTLKVAVKNGADAVYFGARSFSARAKATNIDEDQWTEAFDFLHEHSARAYLALNTLISDREANQAMHLAENAYRTGVDALILQDIGLLCAIHREMPDLPLFASTQMSIGNEPGILAARELGISRVILPRELPEQDVRNLTAYAATIGVETEVFIHGALCVSFSGQCLMSALQGGRSANRGACAQPCRLSYRLLTDRSRESGNQNPRLSLKDLSLYNHIDSLVSAGVASLKIEGRMRSADYVGTVTAAYRRALDGQRDTADSGRLLQAFNRGGAFIDAFFAGRRNPATRSGLRPGSHGVPAGTIAAVRPDAGILDLKQEASQPPLVRGDVLSIRRGQEDIASAPVGTVEKIPMGYRIKAFHPDVLRSVLVGDSLYRMSDTAAQRAAESADVHKTPVELELVTVDATIARLTAACRSMVSIRGVFPQGERIEVSVDRPMDDLPPLAHERVLAQLSKTGGTPFVTDKVASSTPAPNLGVASLNAMRREALQSLSQAIHAHYRRTLDLAGREEPISGFLAMDSSRKAPQPVSPAPALSTESTPVTVHYWQWPADNAPACGADVYLLPLHELTQKGTDRIRSLKAEEPSCRIYTVLPPGLNGDALAEATALVAVLQPEGLDGVSSRTIDIHEQFQTFERSLEPGGNTYNAGSFRCHADKGLKRVCTSLEVFTADLLEILEAADSRCRAEIVLYGRAGVMFTHSCPVGANACTDTDKGICRTGSHQLADERGREFPVVCHPGRCTAEILSVEPVDGLDKMETLLAARFQEGSSLDGKIALRLAFYDEPLEFRRQLTRKAHGLLDRIHPAERTS